MMEKKNSKKKRIAMFAIMMTFVISMTSMVSVYATNSADFIKDNRNTKIINESTLINNLEVKNNVSIQKTYDSFDDVKEVGEKIFYENDDFSGYLFFQSAHRINNSDKFTVVYINGD